MSDDKPDLPIIPPYAEFIKWLNALPDTYEFKKAGTFDYDKPDAACYWPCCCPVATFLALKNGKPVAVSCDSARFFGNTTEVVDNSAAPLSYEYGSVVYAVDNYGLSNVDSLRHHLRM